MIYLITGRTGSGKKHLAKILENKYNFKGLQYTNTKNLTTTEIYDMIMAIKRDMKMPPDFIIVNPDVVNSLATKLPDETFHLIYIHGDEEKRKNHAADVNDFVKRDKEESQCFKEFEQRITNATERDMFEDNITVVHTIYNSFDDKNDNIETEAQILNSKKQFNKALATMIEIAMYHNILNCNDENKIVCTYCDETEQYVTPEHFADILDGDDTGFAMFVKNWIVSENNFTDALPQILNHHKKAKKIMSNNKEKNMKEKDDQNAN